MLGVLLYGFHRGWRSSREFQKACEENDAMRYLVAGTACIDQEIISYFREKISKNLREQKIRYRLQCSKLFFCVEAQALFKCE